MVILVLSILTQNRGGTGDRVGCLKFSNGVLERRAAVLDGVMSRRRPDYLTGVIQSEVPLSQRHVPPATPQSGRAHTGAESVADARTELLVFNLRSPVIAGVNE